MYPDKSFSWLPKAWCYLINVCCYRRESGGGAVWNSLTVGRRHWKPYVYGWIITFPGIRGHRESKAWSTNILHSYRYCTVYFEKGRKEGVQKNFCIDLLPCRRAGLVIPMAIASTFRAPHHHSVWRFQHSFRSGIDSWGSYRLMLRGRCQTQNQLSEHAVIKASCDRVASTALVYTKTIGVTGSRSTSVTKYWAGTSQELRMGHTTPRCLPTFSTSSSAPALEMYFTSFWDLFSPTLGMSNFSLNTI